MSKDSAFYKEKNKKLYSDYTRIKTTIPEFTHGYLDGLLENNQLSTVVAYAHDLNRFFRFIVSKNPIYADYNPQDIPFELMTMLKLHDLDEYKNWLRFEDGNLNAPGSLSRKITPIKNWFRWAIAHEELSNFPFIEGTHVKHDKSDVLKLSKKQVKSLQSVVQNTELTHSKRSKAYSKKTAQRDTAIISLFLSTGIRISELQGIDITDIDHVEKRITIVRKGGYDSSVYVSPETLDILDTYIQGERARIAKDCPDELALFLSIQHKRMCVKAIENLVKKYTREVTKNNKYTAHKLRSTFGTNLYKKTKDPEMVKDALGHSSLNTLTHYINVANENRKAVAEEDIYNIND